MKTNPSWLAVRAFGMALSAITMSGADFPKNETVTYRQIGDLAIKADVFYFSDTKTRPAIVSLHGGALIMGHRGSIAGPVKDFALTNGYVLVSLDYRLAPETKLSAIIEDIEVAFQWLRRESPQRYHVDPQCIAVTGGSAGGYLTLVTGYRVQPRPRALLAYYGYGDLIGDWYSKPSPHQRHNPQKITADEAWSQVSGPPVSDARERKGNGGLFYNFCRQNGTWPTSVSGWKPDADAEKFLPYMPIKNVTPQFPPTALIHGTVDTDVPFEQSKLMADQFTKHAVPHQFHIIENAEHGLTGGDRAKISEAERKAFEFLKYHLEKTPNGP